MCAIICKIRLLSHGVKVNPGLQQILKMSIFVKDPCGFICITLTYIAVFYADYVVIRWVIMQTMQDRYDFICFKYFKWQEEVKNENVRLLGLGLQRFCFFMAGLHTCRLASQGIRLGLFIGL